MILMTAALVKVILLVICAGGIFALLRKHCSRKNAILFACCVAAVGGLFAQKISSYVPPLTDVVTITATGEKNPEAKGKEIVLNYYTVDGETTAFHDVVSGKWFWFGESYMWRPESDVRQPEGTTRTIQIEIPVGWERSVDFDEGVYRGIVQVEYAGNVITEDLYAPSSSKHPVPIESSSHSRLILNQVRYLAVFAVVLVFMSGMIALLYRKWLRDGITPLAWLSDHFWVVYLLIAVCSFFYMFLFAGKEALWQDELSTIHGIVKDWSLYEVLIEEHSDYYPALPTYTISKWWYGISPYGEQWLLLPMIVFTVCGNFFVALSAEKIRNRSTAVITSVFLAFNYPLIYHCGYEFRPYFALYCAAAILLYLFLVKNQRMLSGKSAVKYEIWFAIWIFLAASCHVFGVFYAGLFFLVDCVLCMQKKLKLRFCIPYFTAVVLFLPWFYNMLCYKVFSMVALFQLEPTWERVVSLLKTLSGKNSLTFWLMILGGLVGLFSILIPVRSGRVSCSIQFSTKRYTFSSAVLPNSSEQETTERGSASSLWGFIPAYLIIGMIVGLFLYGKYISPSATMWVERYFAPLYPAAAVLIGIGLDQILGSFRRKTFKHVIAAVLALIFIISSYGNLIADVSVEKQSFREAADWLYSQGNSIYRDDTAVLFCGRAEDMTGWMDYHLEQRGRRDPINVIFMHYSNTTKTFADYNTVYVHYEVKPCHENVQKILDEQFNLTATNADVKIKTYVRKAAS